MANEVTTLDGLTLPGDLLFSDDYNGWTPVEQSLAYTLEGNLVIEESVKLAGRPISLQGAVNRAWIERGMLEQLRTRLTPGKEMALVLADGRTFTVTWRHGATPIEAEPVMPLAPVDDTLDYVVTLRLLEL